MQKAYTVTHITTFSFIIACMTSQDGHHKQLQLHQDKSIQTHDIQLYMIIQLNYRNKLNLDTTETHATIFHNFYIKPCNNLASSNIVLCTTVQQLHAHQNSHCSSSAYITVYKLQQSSCTKITLIKALKCKQNSTQSQSVPATLQPHGDLTTEQSFFRR